MLWLHSFVLNSMAPHLLRHVYDLIWDVCLLNSQWNKGCWLPLLLTEICRNCHVQLVTKIHVTISERAAKADVNTDGFVIQQWSNSMKWNSGQVIVLKCGTNEVRSVHLIIPFFTSFKSKCSPTDHSETWFEFSVLVMQLYSCHQMI